MWWMVAVSVLGSVILSFVVVGIGAAIIGYVAMK